VDNTEESLPASSMQSDVKEFAIMDGFSNYSVTRGPNEDFEVSTSKNPADNQLLSRVGKTLDLKCPLLLLIFEAETVFANVFARSSSTHIESRNNCSQIVFRPVVDFKAGKSVLKMEDILRLLRAPEEKIVGTVFLSQNKLKEAFENGSHYFIRLSRSSREAASSYPKTVGCSVNVLLGQRRGDYMERVAVGRIDIEAWKGASPIKKVIKLM
jgi:hypothetical protein